MSSPSRPATVVDQPAGAGLAPAKPVSAWLRFFRSELRLVFRRPRNLALLGVLAAVPVFLGVVFRLTLSSDQGVGGPAFLNQLAGNGVFLALVVMPLMLAVILPLAMAVVAGDSVAGEASHGTLRGLLAVPAGRTRLLTVKYAVIVMFAVRACVLVTGLALIMGLILFHTGPVTLLSGTTVSLGAGVLRIAVVALYAAAAMAALGAVGLAVSTLTEHPVGAIAGLVVLVVTSEIADSVPQLSAVHPFLPTHFWLSWDGLLTSPVDWSGIEHGLLSFAAYIVIFFACAWARLSSADITS